MKFRLSLLALAFALLQSCGPTQVVVQDRPLPPPEPMEVSYQSFYDELSPYGRWIDYPGYGYVWMPTVNYGFKPYATNGHWIFTDQGWTWASDYPWGWAAFHYGRWMYEPGYGWMWLPGHEWAPAWVSWRSSDEFYGWAPLGPNVSFGVTTYNPPSNYWCFVPHQHIASPQINNYYVNETRNVTIINNTTVIHNTTVVNNNTTVINNNNTTINNNNVRNVYRGGPDPREVERYTGTPVRPVALGTSSRPGEQSTGGQYNLFRPRVSPPSAPVNNAAAVQPRPAPTQVHTLREIAPVEAPRSENQAPATPVSGNPNQPRVEHNNARPSNAGFSGNENPAVSPAAPAVNANGNNHPVGNDEHRNNAFDHPVNNPPHNNPSTQVQAVNPPPKPANNTSPAVHNNAGLVQPANGGNHPAPANGTNKPVNTANKPAPAPKPTKPEEKEEKKDNPR